MDIRKRFSFLGSSEDVISMVLGLLIVVVVAGLVVNYFQKKSGGSVSLPGVTDTVVPSAGVSPVASVTGEQERKISGSEYLVMRGDSLWKISQRKYGSGYNWVDIVKANGLRDTGLAIGQRLVLPDVPIRVAVVRKAVNPIDGGEYVVNKGDSLSKIALRAYGDSFAWTKIYQANRQVIGKPNLIFAGTKLTIPR